MQYLRNYLSTKHTNITAKRALLFLAAVLLTGTAGCIGQQKKQAQDLVRAGSATSEQLVRYYNALGQRRADHMSLEVFRLRRAEFELGPDTKKAYEGQLEALAARADMARRMKGVYDSLGKLIDYDAPGEIGGAVLELKRAIESVSKTKIPGFSGSDPETALKQAISAFVGWQQIRQFRKNAPKAQEVLDGITQLYEGEKDIYIQMSEDYYDLAHKTARFLHERRQLSGTSAFKSYADVYELQVLPELPHAADKETQTYIVAVEAFINSRLDAKLKEFKELSRREASGHLEALRTLKKTHEDFMLKRWLS